MMSRKHFIIMQTIVAVLVVLVLVIFAAGCAGYQQPVPRHQVDAEVSEVYEITYTFNAYDSLTRKMLNLPIRYTTTVPGWANDIADDQTPSNVTVLGAKRPKAFEYNSVSGTITSGATASTVLECSWVAVTVSGTKTSERSRGGEDEGTGPSATATCEYRA